MSRLAGHAIKGKVGVEDALCGREFDDERGSVTTNVKIDHVTHDKKNAEYVVYLVEDGPWPRDADDDEQWEQSIARIYDRILSACDAVIDGVLSAHFPGSHGGNVRLQVDSPSGLPSRLNELISDLRRHLVEDDEYASAIRGSEYIGDLRLVTGHELGRFDTGET